MTDNLPTETVNGRSLLKARQGDRTLFELGVEIGVSPAYLCDILNGRRELGPKVLRYLGLTKAVKRVVTYRRIPG